MSRFLADLAFERLTPRQLDELLSNGVVSLGVLPAGTVIDPWGEFLDKLRPAPDLPKPSSVEIERF